MKRNNLRDIPLRTKLVLQYAAVITGITVVMAGCFYIYSAGAVQAKNNDFFRSVTQQTVSSLNNLFMGWRTAAACCASTRA